MPNTDRSWQAIETAPYGEYVLVWVPQTEWMYIATRDDDGWICEIGVALRHSPTHWMPLPEDPVTPDSSTPQT